MPSLEDELFELVFECLDRHTATKLVIALVGSDVELPTEQQGVREVTLESLPLRAGVTIDDAHVRLLCYDRSVYDIEVNFQLRHCSAVSHDALVQALYDFAVDLAEVNGIDTYFAGLEPASDEDTRMFTGKEKGPYFRVS